MKKSRQVSDLAMVAALAQYAEAAGIEDEKKRYLFGKLKSRIDKRFSRLQASMAELRTAYDKGMAFDKVTGWRNNKRMHVGTYCSFCLCILESYTDDLALNITDILRQICGLFEDCGEWSGACDWAGALAFERYEKVWFELLQ